MNCLFIESFIGFCFAILIGQPSEENGIESIIDTTKQIGDGSADRCDINQQIAAATNQPTQLSIATVSAANIETQHQQQVNFKNKIIHVFGGLCCDAECIFMNAWSHRAWNSLECYHENGKVILVGKH